MDMINCLAEMEVKRVPVVTVPVDPQLISGILLETQTKLNYYLSMVEKLHDFLCTENYVISQFIKVKLGRYRGEKYTSRTKQVYKMLVKYNSMDAQGKVKRFHELLAERGFQKQSICVPSQLVCMELLFCTLKAATLLHRIVQFCFDDKLYLQQKMNIGHNVSDILQLTAVISRVWFVSRSLLKVNIDLYASITRFFQSAFPGTPLPNDLPADIHILTPREVLERNCKVHANVDDMLRGYGYKLELMDFEESIQKDKTEDLGVLGIFESAENFGATASQEDTNRSEKSDTLVQRISTHENRLKDVSKHPQNPNVSTDNGVTKVNATPQIQSMPACDSDLGTTIERNPTKKKKKRKNKHDHTPSKTYNKVVSENKTSSRVQLTSKNVSIPSEKNLKNIPKNQNKVGNVKRQVVEQEPNIDKSIKSNQQRPTNKQLETKRNKKTRSFKTVAAESNTSISGKQQIVVSRSNTCTLKATKSDTNPNQQLSKKQRRAQKRKLQHLGKSEKTVTQGPQPQTKKERKMEARRFPANT